MSVTLLSETFAPPPMAGFPESRSNSDMQTFISRADGGGTRLPSPTWQNWYTEIRWFNLAVVTSTPLLAVYGAFTTQIRAQTVAFCALYYFLNMIGEPAPRLYIRSRRLINAT